MIALQWFTDVGQLSPNAPGHARTLGEDELLVRCARQQPFRLKNASALKMERISQQENPAAHVDSKMDFR
jgi:hypothetical protein